MHGVLCTDTRDVMKGDHRGLGVKWRGFSHNIIRGLLWLLDNVVGDFKVEEVGTLVAADVRLITIVAQTLLTALDHVVWREALEGAWGSSRGCSPFLSTSLMG